MEIGSIFELDLIEALSNPKGNKDFFNINEDYKDSKYFNTARSAIKYLFTYLYKLASDEEVLLPAYLCTTISDALEDIGIKYRFYNINENLEIEVSDLSNKINKNTKVIFYIPYFGFPQPQNVVNYLRKLSKDGIFIVEDLTQSLFSDSCDIGIGDFVIASIRKWMPIPDGAVLLSKQKIPEYKINSGYNEFSINYLLAQLMKESYHKKNELIPKLHLDYLEEATRNLKQDREIRHMSPISYEIFERYNFTNLKQRQVNYDYLLKKLSNLKKIKFLYTKTQGVIPLGCPLVVENRQALLRYLIAHKVYCPVHWPLNDYLYKNYPHLEVLYKGIITIPCDQRYSIEDMEYISQLIIKFYNEN